MQKLRYLERQIRRRILLLSLISSTALRNYASQGVSHSGDLHHHNFSLTRTPQHSFHTTGRCWCLPDRNEGVSQMKLISFLHICPYQEAGNTPSLMSVRHWTRQKHCCQMKGWRSPMHSWPTRSAALAAQACSRGSTSTTFPSPTTLYRAAAPLKSGKMAPSKARLQPTWSHRCNSACKC